MFNCSECGFPSPERMCLRCKKRKQQQVNRPPANGQARASLKFNDPLVQVDPRMTDLIAAMAATHLTPPRQVQSWYESIPGSDFIISGSNDSPFIKILHSRTGRELAMSVRLPGTGSRLYGLAGLNFYTVATDVQSGVYCHCIDAVSGQLRSWPYVG